MRAVQQFVVPEAPGRRARIEAVYLELDLRRPEGKLVPYQCVSSKTYTFIRIPDIAMLVGAKEDVGWAGATSIVERHSLCSKLERNSYELEIT